MAIILDVSMPNCCNNCPCYDGMGGANDCNATLHDVGELFDETRPDWCPICGELYIDPEYTELRVDFDINTKAIKGSILHTPEKWSHSGTIKRS